MRTHVWNFPLRHSVPSEVWLVEGISISTANCFSNVHRVLEGIPCRTACIYEEIHGGRHACATSGWAKHRPPLVQVLDRYPIRTGIFTNTTLLAWNASMVPPVDPHSPNSLPKKRGGKSVNPGTQNDLRRPNWPLPSRGGPARVASRSRQKSALKALLHNGEDLADHRKQLILNARAASRPEQGLHVLQGCL